LFASPLSLIASALSSSDTTTESRLKDFSSGDGTDDGGVDAVVGGEEVYEAESLILVKASDAMLVVELLGVGTDRNGLTKNF
jgi:hypothetical protein